VPNEPVGTPGKENGHRVDKAGVKKKKKNKPRIPGRKGGRQAGQILFATAPERQVGRRAKNRKEEKNPTPKRAGSRMQTGETAKNRAPNESELQKDHSTGVTTGSTEN